jgi:predicted Fe-S protein YdhL (DUF1289 family)
MADGQARIFAMNLVRKFDEWRCRLSLVGTLALAAMLVLPLTTPVVAAQHRPNAPKAAPQGAPRQNTRNDRPPNAGNRANGEHGGAQTIPRPNSNVETNPNRPPTQSPNNQDRWRNMSPSDRQRVLQNEDRLRRMSPAQQQVLRDRAQVWNRMTPEQRDHVRNDVLPQWRQMPPDRKQAIRSRLRVLQNMPESARNQRLSDPNFTRGMSDEDRSTLRDLSHLHVGGSPE